MKMFGIIGAFAQIGGRGRRSGWGSIAGGLLAAALAIGSSGASAATFTEATLFGFNGVDGNAPGGQMIQASDGNYYGVTCKGGATAGSDSGTVWKLTPAGQQTVLHSFTATTGDDDGDVLNTDGDCPQGVVQGADLHLYGLTRDGGSNGGGVVFSLALDGSGFTVLHNFGNLHSANPAILQDGVYPYGTMIPGADGNFYGTTLNGGTADSQGTIFSITPLGTYQQLYSFGHGDENAPDADGAGPIGTLVQGTDGNFYGVTYGGGSRNVARDGSADGSGGGVAYRFNPSNATLTVLHAFKEFDSQTGDGYEPFTNLVETADGAFYGMTAYGGSEGVDDGTLFRISSSGIFTLLHSFTVGNSNGTPPQPRGLTLGSDGNVYGTTMLSNISDAGTVFQLVPSADGAFPGPLNTAYEFESPGSTGDGATPTGPLVQGSDGSILGPLAADGPNASVNGGGAIFQLAASPALSAPVQLTLTPSTLTVGQSPAQTATLSWNVLNATSQTYSNCFASDSWSGSKAASGSQVVASSASGTAGSYRYALTCGGVETSSVTLTVLPGGQTPAPTVTITANPASIVLGSSTTLSWSSTNANSCTASGAWSGSQPVSGSSSQQPAATGNATYTLSCTGAGGTSQASTIVKVQAPAPTVTITVNPTSIMLGNTAMLNWSSTNATSCNATGAWSGSVAINGTQTEQPAATGDYTYYLSCSSDGGITNAVAHATLTVTAAPIAPTVTISINPSSITVGSSATLMWSSTNASACTASGAWSGEVATSGSLDEHPGATGNFTYTLTCTGAGGSSSNSVTLTVNPADGGTTGGGTSGGGTTTGGGLKVPVKAGGGAFGLPALLSMLGLAGLRRSRKMRQLLMGVIALGFGIAHADAPAPNGLDQFASHLYAGVRLGAMDQLVDRHQFERQLAAAGYNVNLESANDAFAGSIYLGYRIHSLVGFELGYTHRDATVVTLSGATTDNLQGLLDTAVKNLKAYGDIYSASLRFHGEVLPNLLLTPRVGTFYWDDETKARANGLHASASHSGGGVTVGAGLSYRIWRGLEIGGGVDYFGGNRHNDAALYAGTIDWYFGR